IQSGTASDRSSPDQRHALRRPRGDWLTRPAGIRPADFPSDLTVSEYVLLGEAGFEPLGFVIGSSVYHIGLQVGRWNQNQELGVLTQAMYNARELAMTRMQ